MNEKKKDNKQDRMKRLQTLLSRKTEISRKDICLQLDISEATLSIMLKELRAVGWQIITPPRSGMVITEFSPGYYETTTAYYVRRWLILLLFQRYGTSLYAYRYTLSFAELTAAAAALLSGEDFRTLLETKLYKRYTNADIGAALSEELRGGFSVYTLRTDLAQMIKEGYVTGCGNYTKETRYALTGSAVLFMCTDKATVKDFRTDYIYLHYVTQMEEEIDNIYRFVSLLFSEKDVIDGRIVRGRVVRISDESKERLHYFQRFPYFGRMLRITYIDRNEREIKCDFATGLVIYSIEKNRFYLIGKVQNEDRIIRMESIKQIKTLPQSNTHFHSREYKAMFDEMFSVSTEQPVHVAVRFKRFGNIPFRIRKLHNIRPKSVLDETSFEGELRFEDDIRGIGDFARYLRSLGSGCIVEEPVALREQMIESFKRVVNGYREDTI